jgi:nucleoside phosphorylase
LTPFGEAFIQSVNNMKCVFFQGGTSKTRSAASCQYAIDKWKPKRHFVIGTAGGVAVHLKECDIIIANKTAMYDYKYCMGEPYELIANETIVEIDNSWIDFSILPGNTLEGFIATADRDVDYDTKIKLQSANVIAADWESGAVALVCRLNNIPCHIIRGITDIPENSSSQSCHNQGIAYVKNTPMVMKEIINSILSEII